MENERHMIDPETLRTWMVQYITKVLDIEPGLFSTSATFDTYGLDSVEAVIMAGVMEEEFQVQIDPMRFYEAPSVDRFVATFAAPASSADDTRP